MVASPRTQSFHDIPPLYSSFPSDTICLSHFLAPTTTSIPYLKAAAYLDVTFFAFLPSSTACFFKPSLYWMWYLLLSSCLFLEATMINWYLSSRQHPSTAASPGIHSISSSHFARVAGWGIYCRRVVSKRLITSIDTCLHDNILSTTAMLGIHCISSSSSFFFHKNSHCWMSHLLSSSSLPKADQIKRYLSRQNSIRAASSGVFWSVSA